MDLRVLIIAADIFMGISALIVDWGDFFVVKWYLIPFVPICPLYPFLLALIFFLIKRRGEQKINQPLLHFTLIGTIGYGIMAYIFYPTYLITQGFAWYELGNMFWVTLYASQALLLIPLLKKIHFLWYAPVMGYFIAKDLLDRFGETFSYHREEIFSLPIENFFLASIILLHLGAFIMITRLSSTHSK